MSILLKPRDDKGRYHIPIILNGEVIHYVRAYCRFRAERFVQRLAGRQIHATVGGRWIRDELGEHFESGYWIRQEA